MRTFAAAPRPQSDTRSAKLVVGMEVLRADERSLAKLTALPPEIQDLQQITDVHEHSSGTGRVDGNLPECLLDVELAQHYADVGSYLSAANTAPAATRHASHAPVHKAARTQNPYRR